MSIGRAVRRTIILREEAEDGTVLETPLEVDLHKPSRLAVDNSGQNLARPEEPYSRAVTVSFFQTVTPSTWEQQLAFFEKIGMTRRPDIDTE